MHGLSSCSVMSDSLRPHGLQHTRLPCPSPSPRACSNSCVGDAIQPSCPGSSKWMSSSHQVAKLLDLQCRHQSFQWIFRIDFLLVWSPCSPEDCQESSPTPQFKSINSSVLSFLYSATLTSIHEYWKNHRFDYQVEVRILNVDLPENYQRNTET